MKIANPAACVLVLFTAGSVRAAGPELVTSWNEHLYVVAEAEDHLMTLKGVRAAAMMHFAVHDALNSIERRYTAYTASADARDADPQLAAAQAAYVVALDQYPAEIARWKRELERWATAVSSPAVRDRSIAAGTAAARRVLELRIDDGWNREVAYSWQPAAPGVYADFSEHSGTPPGFVFGMGWAQVRPFGLRSPSQFRAPPPPAVASAEYARAFNEVKELGGLGSSARTQDQSHLAMWWKEFVESSHNRLARELVTADRTELRTAARLFALLNAAVVDSYIASFENKFHYNHWRPFTAIRRADHDGNPDTGADPEWNTAHRHTYPFPSYPSAHGTACAAAMTVLAETFGERRHFTMETAAVNSSGPGSPLVAMQPPSRSFESFSAAAKECALSRVYLGIHFRYDSLAGNRLGTDVGSYITANLLRPVSRKP